MKTRKPELMLQYSFGYRTTPADLNELGELLNKMENPHEISIGILFSVIGSSRLDPNIGAIWLNQAERASVENHEIIDLLDVARGRRPSTPGRKAKAKQ